MNSVIFCINFKKDKIMISLEEEEEVEEIEILKIKVFKIQMLD
jgi:hypothetical protein